MKVAVAVRAHRTTRKLEASLRSLAGSDSCDLYLVANETRNEVEAFGATKLIHTAQIMAPLGSHLASEVHLIHGSDMVFSFLHDALPSHGFILVVEDDVHFPFGGRQTVEKIVDAVRSHPDGVDLLATKLRKAEQDWWWYEEGRRSFADVRAMLFSMVGMSVRTIEQLRAARHREAASAGAGGLVFCEAFVPSALAARGGFRMLDVNTLLPGAYQDHLFTIGLPFLLEDPAWPSRGVEMAHPVFSAAEFLERRFVHARIRRRHAGVPGRSGNQQASIEPALRAEYAARAGAVLTMEIADRLRHLEALLHR